MSDPVNSEDLPAPTPPAGDEPTQEAPSTSATAAPPAADGPATATVPTTPAPVAGPPAEHRPGLFLPRWVAFVAAAVILFGLGFILGHAVGSDDGHDRTAVVDGPRRFAPGSPGAGGFGPGPGSNQFGGRNGSGPGAGRGFGNGNGNGEIPGPSTTSGMLLGVAAADSSNPAGAEIVRVVTPSPASRAGIRRGDVVTAVDGTKITDAASLTQAVRSHSAGDELTIDYTRNGSSTTVHVTLARVGGATTQQ
ncbi:MAG: PDZ domain-containing protein [Acidimicrobiia bacterium]